MPRTAMPQKLILLLFGALALSGTACTGPQPAARNQATAAQSHASSVASPALRRMGYAIQVGAFGELGNAARLQAALQSRGIDAYYFRHASGLYKVRFGNHTTYGTARSQAEQLKSQGLIGTFFIVRPDAYAAASHETQALRTELVTTARGFLGVPYRWGGTDSERGFDCSGLTMACYRLNGLDLPRVSRRQFRSGRHVAKNALRKGDLVFFATNGGRRVSHVGIYIGGNRFIHAPKSGRTVQVENLSNPYFSKTYVGARTYL